MVQQSMPEAETGLYDALMQAPAMVAILRGKNLKFELANPLYLKVVGKTDDIIGKSLLDVLPEIKNQPINKILGNVYETGKPYIGNEVLIRIDTNNDGGLEDIYFNFVYQPLKDAAGQVTGIMAHGVDVTAQVRDRQMIAESEERYQTLFNSIDQGFCVFKMIFDDAGKPIDYRFLETNHVFEQQTGLKGVQGKTARQLVPGLEDSWFKLYGRVAMTGKTAHFSQGSEAMGRWFDVSAYRVGRAADHRVALLFSDVTERKHAESALKASEERFRFMAESIPQKIFTATPAGMVDYFNRQWQEYTGVPLTKLEADGVRGYIHHDDLPGNLEQWQRALKSGVAFQTELRLLRADGRYRRHFSQVWPMRYESGKIVRWFGSITDIEDLIQTTAQRDQLEGITKQLKQQRTDLIAHNKSKDEFISLASHQLRTPATGVKQFLGMVLDGFAGEPEPDQRQLLQRAYDSNERQIAIVNDLLKVAQVDAGKVVLKREPTEFVTLLRSVLDEQKAKFTSRQQTVAVTHTRAQLTALADRPRIRMVFENIIDNASKYTPVGKAITVRLSRSAGMVRVAVSDNGVGIPESERSKLFRKFSRLDNPLSVSVGGTGLGLYWANKIVGLHGGWIEVGTAEGGGSVFTVCLPLG